ncbi:acyl-CoA N-acyltransferase [Lipomyces arxii]|uniref:acyl-CoA N-acyltransferase n=1 Tax=Lipomyces arxii TaxID=56418 RepID=UPI0034CE8782
MAIVITQQPAFLPLLPIDDSIIVTDSYQSYLERANSLDLSLLKSKDIESAKKLLRETLAVGYSTTFLNQFIYNKDSFCFCVRDTIRNAVIGVIGGKISRSVMDSTVCTGHLMILAVSTTWRRFGLGQQLLNKLEGAFCDGSVTASFNRRTQLRSIYLQTEIANTNAIRFYENNGFSYEKLERGYYGSGKDGVVMRKHVC